MENRHPPKMQEVFSGHLAPENLRLLPGTPVRDHAKEALAPEAIVHAVECYDDMLEALKELRAFAGAHRAPGSSGAWAKLNQAIAKAERHT